MKNLRKSYSAIRVGILPAGVINRVLGTELEATEVWVSKIAHRHIAEDHSEEYEVIMAEIGRIVAEPMFVGQDPKHADAFYVVRPVPKVGEKSHGLVAIRFELNKFGTYNVKSAYGIKQSDIDSRRSAGRLKQVF